MRHILVLLVLLPTLCLGETTLEIGQGWASGDPGNAALILGERNKNYGVGLGWIEAHGVRADGENHWLQPNMFIDVQRFWQYKKLEFGIGPSYFQNTNRALAKNFNWSVSVSYNVDPHFAVIIRHWSNAGTGAYNMGHDFLGIRFSFGN